MEEGKKRSLTIGKETIEVSEEVYRAYMRPIKAISKAKMKIIKKLKLFLKKWL